MSSQLTLGTSTTVSRSADGLLRMGTELPLAHTKQLALDLLQAADVVPAHVGHLHDRLAQR